MFKVYDEFLISILRYIIKIQENFGRDYCNIVLSKKKRHQHFLLTFVR